MAINKVDFTDLSDSQKATFQTQFELTDYTDSATIELASGRSEYLDPYPYRVEGGDETIVDGSVANGNVYVHVLDGGSGVATAYLDTNEGTWDDNKGGYYYTVTGAKVVFKMVKSTGPVYSKKVRMTDPRVNTLFSGRGRTPTDFMADGTATPPIDWGTIYDQMSPYLPNTGDEMIVSGGVRGTVGGTPEGVIVSKARRKDASTITLYGMQFSSFSGTDNFSFAKWSHDMTTADSNIVVYSLAW
jgi:hypothetical protein